MKNLYGILEIADYSDVATVKKAFKTLSRKYHPDNMINASKEEQDYALEKQKELSEAYTTLSNPEKKKAYDEQRKKETKDTSYQGSNFNRNDNKAWENRSDFTSSTSKKEQNFSFFHESDFHNDTMDQDIWEEYDFKTKNYGKKSHSTSQNANYYNAHLKRLFEEYFNFGASTSDSRKLSDLYSKKYNLEMQMQERESIIREMAMPKIKEKQVELQKDYLNLFKSLGKVQENLKNAGSKLVRLKNRKIYQLMPSRFKEVEAIMVKEIIELERKQIQLRKQIEENRQEIQSVYDSVINKEKNKDAIINTLLIQIQFVELEIEKLEEMKENTMGRKVA